MWFHSNQHNKLSKTYALSLAHSFSSLKSDHTSSFFVEQKKTKTMASRTITLISSDGQQFEVSEEVAVEFQTINNFIRDGSNSPSFPGKMTTRDQEIRRITVFPIPNINGKILLKVIEYCKKHLEYRLNSRSDDTEIKEFDSNFINEDRSTLFNLTLAAHFLQAEDLFNFLTLTLANKIKTMSNEQVRDYLGLDNDFTPEEERANRRVNQWGFE